MELGFTFDKEIKITIGIKEPVIKNPVGKPKGLKLTRRRKKERIDGKAKVYCKICNCWYQHRIKKQHSRTIKHLINNYIM